MAAAHGGVGLWGVRDYFKSLLSLFAGFLLAVAITLTIKSITNTGDDNPTTRRLDIFLTVNSNTTATSTALNVRNNNDSSSTIVEEFLESIMVYSKVGRATSTATVADEEKVENGNEMDTGVEECDLFSGEWVYDNTSGPMYSGVECKFLHDEIACDKYGRKDDKYKNWRWQPHGCDLPRFDAKRLLERLRGKRLVYVGDSLNRNQWVSMVCLVEAAVPEPMKWIDYKGSLWSFKAMNYNVSIDFYWSPLLAESNCDDPYNHRLEERMMKNGSIEKHARNWDQAEIIVFNSYLWWKKPRMKMKVLAESALHEDTNKTYTEVEMIRGFELALNAWSGWLESHVDSKKQQIFFMSLSPTHVWSEDWGMEGGQNCYNETEPITKVGYTGRGTDPAMIKIAENKIHELNNRGVHVQFLNITQLSEYRKDGHPSIYRKFWDNLTEDQLANPSSYSDCTHWCLPGVPDVWNEILSAYIFARKL